MTAIALLKTAPQALLLDLAYGLDSDNDIAVRHGVSVADIDRLRNSDPFRQDIAQLAAELRNNGSRITRKAVLGFELLLEDVLSKALSADAGLSTKLDVLKTFGRYGRLEPVEGAGGAGRFSIQIDLSDNPGERRIQAVVQTAPTEAQRVIDIPVHPDDGLGSTPTYVTPKGLTLLDDLSI